MASVPAVMEAAAVGVTPPGGGPEQLVMFLVLHKTAKIPAQSPGNPDAPQAASSPQSHAASPEQAQATLDTQSHQASLSQRQGAADRPGKTSPGTKLSPAEGVNQQASDLGFGSSLNGLWDAVGRAKITAAAAASRVADAAIAAVQTVPMDVQGQPKASGTGSNDSQLQELKLQCQRAIRSSLNPLFKLERVLLRDSLPRTASNKVMRRLLRDELRQASAKL